MAEDRQLEDRMKKGAPEHWNAELEERVRLAISQIRYGTITLVIQDGRVIQIDKNEKIRLT